MKLKLKLQYFGHLMRTTDSLERPLMLGKIAGKRRRGWQRIRWLDSITISMDMNLGSLAAFVQQGFAPPGLPAGARKERDRGGTKWGSGFATLSLVTGEVLLGAGFLRSGRQLRLLWEERCRPPRGGLPPAWVPGCSREKALGGDKALLFHGKESFCSQNLLTALGKWLFFFFSP